MGNGLDIAPPPKKATPETASAANDEIRKPSKQGRVAKAAPTKFDKVAEGDKVQFNKRVNRATADGFDMLAITTRRKVPELLDEALEMLKEKYGKI
tara:strand:+ start:99 stop:386 length:288 start_codon:yes stop_codon:yes gene_type:complete